MSISITFRRTGVMGRLIVAATGQVNKEVVAMLNQVSFSTLAVNLPAYVTYPLVLRSDADPTNFILCHCKQVGRGYWLLYVPQTYVNKMLRNTQYAADFPVEFSQNIDGTTNYTFRFDENNLCYIGDSSPMIHRFHINIKDLVEYFGLKY